LDGLFELNADTRRIKRELIQRLENESLETLYQELTVCDPRFAARISPQDLQRIIRGLEVWFATGIPLSQHWQEQADKQSYHAFRILLAPERSLLYDRIDHRVLLMVRHGLVEEIHQILKRGYDSSTPGLNTLGYKELLSYSHHETTLEVCLDLIRQHTRNYAKRQCTWYRKHKFHLTLTSPDLNISDVTTAIRSFFHM